MPNASFPIGTIRRPSASVTSRRASGMERRKVYQNVDAEHVELVAEEERRQGQHDEDDDGDHGPPPPADLDRFPDGIRCRGPAAVADDGLLGDFSAAVPADHRHRSYSDGYTRKNSAKRRVHRWRPRRGYISGG